jgi:hypothetical protein
LAVRAGWRAVAGHGEGVGAGLRWWQRLLQRAEDGRGDVPFPLLKRTKNPTDADIDAIENVCRCGSYFRIRAAIKAAGRRAADVTETKPTAATGHIPLCARTVTVSAPQ